MLSYLLSLTLPASAAAAAYFDRPALFLLPVIIGVPIIDAIIGREKKQPAPPHAGTLATYIPHAFIALWLVSIWFTGQKLEAASTFDRVFLFLNAGFVGAIASAHAHELLHRACGVSNWLASFSTALFGYSHYVPLHLNHHAGTGEEKYGSAPAQGKCFWSTMPKSAANGFREAWASEHAANGACPIRNAVIRQWLLTGVFALLFYTLWGSLGLGLYVFQCIFAFLLVEVGGYIQHYGLTRKAGDPVNQDLSWDCDYWLTNRLLINLPRHGAHHRDATRQFTQLEYCTRTLPQGYFLMLWVALCPPLWMPWWTGAWVQWKDRRLGSIRDPYGKCASLDHPLIYNML